MKVLQNVQGLRAIAALLVVCVHMGNPDGFEVRYMHSTAPILAGLVQLGREGVDLFFIISGFIMTVTTLGRQTLPTSGRFFLGRIIRIYPPLWIITTLILLIYVQRPELVNSHSPYPPDILASFLALPQRGSPLLLVGWTLVYEMYFYVVFSLALAFGRRTFTPVLALWALLTLCLNFVVGASPNPWLFAIANPICFEFLVGVVVGRLYLAHIYGPSMLFLVGGLILCAAASIAGFGDSWHRVLTSLPFAFVLLGLVGLEREHRLVAPPIIGRLGDASYAAYLWHVPVLALLGTFIARTSLAHAQPWQDAVVIVVCLALVELVALGLYRYVESPLTEWLRRQLLERSPPPRAAAQR